MRTIYIEPPAHLNSCPARKVLLERSMLVEKHKFGIRKFILQKNQRFLVRGVKADDNDVWYVANKDAIRFAQIQVFKKHWKDWELRIWTFD